MSRADHTHQRGLKVNIRKQLRRWAKTPEGKKALARIEAERKAAQGDNFTAELVNPEPQPSKARR